MASKDKKKVPKNAAALVDQEESDDKIPNEGSSLSLDAPKETALETNNEPSTPFNDREVSEPKFVYFFKDGDDTLYTKEIDKEPLDENDSPSVIPEVNPVLMGKELNIKPGLAANNLELLSVEGLANEMISTLDIDAEKTKDTKMKKGKKYLPNDEDSHFQTLNKRNSFTDLFAPDLSKIAAPSKLADTDLEQLFETIYVPKKRALGEKLFSENENIELEDEDEENEVEINCVKLFDLSDSSEEEYK